MNDYSETGFWTLLGSCTQEPTLYIGELQFSEEKGGVDEEEGAGWETDGLGEEGGKGNCDEAGKIN